MPIPDDWDLDFPNTVLNHVDGVLSYDTGAGRQAVVGEYVRGIVSGAIGKVIAVTGNTTSGTLTLTSVEGLFDNNELLDALSELNFDAVTAGNGGFAVGNTIVDQVTGTIVVRAIEYNTDGLGGGTIYGTAFATFVNDAQLDISGGQLDVADADGVGINNDAALTTTLVAGTLAVPGTVSTNDSQIIHYDVGTIAIPEQAIIEDAVTGAQGLVEQVIGVLATGSVRLVDINTAAFTDNNALRADQVIAYNNQVAGQVFNVGDVVLGVTSGATGRVLLDTGTELILADESGTWVTTEDLNVKGVKIADANGTNTTLNLATINLPDGLRTEQRPTSVGGGVGQGGIYASATGLNIVRKLNSLYTFSQDTFDELVQLDDDEAMDAAFKGFAYSLVFGWRIQKGGERYLRKGALADTTGAEVWANPQTQGAQNKIGALGFLIDATNTFRQPQIYMEQNGLKVVPWYLEGNIDILLKVRTREDTRFVVPATPALGQLIPGGDPQQGGFYAVFNHEFYTSTFDTTEVDGSGGVVNSVALGTSDDTAADRNPQGTHTFAWDLGSAATLLVGEEFFTVAGNNQKVGIVVAQTGDAGAAGTVEYVLKSGAQFADNESVTAKVSNKTFDVDETGGFDATNDVVAGFATDIAFAVVDIAADSTSSTIAGTFTPGEAVSQAVTGATGRAVFANVTTDILYIEVDAGSAAFSGLNVITGGSSAATWTPTVSATYVSTLTFSADLNNGEGAQPYAGTVGANIVAAGAETIQNVYQYSKFLSAAEQETTLIGGPGTAGGDAPATIGNLFRRLKDAYTEVKPGAPFGTFTGSMALGQGWFLDTGFLSAADIRSFSVVDDNGVLRNPPNLQSLTIAGVDSGWRVAAFRSTGAGLFVILRNEFDVGVVGGGNNQAADSTILVGANSRTVSPLPADVPDTGVLYVLDPNDTGNFLQFPYNAVNRTTNIFTLTSGTIGAVTGSVNLTLDDNVHVAFIREIAAAASVTNTIQFVANIELVFKARLKGFKPFVSTGQFSLNGFTGGVVQSPDTIVDLP